MSDTKFTPGPWGTGWNNGLSGDVVSWQCFLDDTECSSIPIFKDNEAICVINYGDPTKPHEANAAL